MFIWKKIFTITFLGLNGLLVSSIVNATQITNIKVLNGENKASIILKFNGQPTYTYFSQPSLHKVLVNIKTKQAIFKGLPIQFSKKNILSCIHTGHNSTSDNKIQLIFDVTRKIKIGTSHVGQLVVFTLKYELPVTSLKISLNNPNISAKSNVYNSTIAATNLTHTNKFPTTKKNIKIKKAKSIITAAHRNTHHNSYKIVVAIDAGHGGQDPGAVGIHGIYEKNITLSIAKRLQNLMDNDHIFQPVLTRTGDYFVTVMGRTEVARRKKANLLISIHSDAAPNRSVSGSSVWLLSDSCANNEMANWLRKHHKQSELLGGAGDVLANNVHDKYLSQAVIDLQFGHSKRVGTDVAIRVIREMKLIGNLHKRQPEHANLGVLRSPDIPSLLVETGFISNYKEERLLNSPAYQEKIAKAIYNGVRNYFIEKIPQSKIKIENHSKILV